MTAIVTESISCMTRQDCQRLNVRLMPLSYVINGKAYTDSQTPRAFCPPGTYSVAPTAEQYYRVFGEYVSRGVNVLCITTSRKISTSASNALIASKAFPAGRIAVLDCKSVAGAMHLLAHMARDLEEAGAGFTDIVRILQVQRDKLVTSFSMNTISNLRDAKRLSRIMHTGAAPILNQKPVCVIENGGIILKKSVSGVYGEIRELVGVHRNPRRIIVHYGSRDMICSELIQALRARHPRAEIILRPVTAALRVNLGDEILGVVSLGERT